MKKLYFQPEVQVARVALESMVLAGSSTTLDVHTDIEGEQW
jgi:hypothetical protein